GIAQLIRSPLRGNRPLSGKAQDLRFEEQLSRVGDVQEDEVRDPWADKWQFDSPGQLPAGRAVHDGCFLDLVGDPVEPSVDDEYPGARALEEEHQGENHGEVCRLGRLVEGRVTEPGEQRPDWAVDGVEQEEPEDEVAHPGQCPRQVVDEPQASDQPTASTVQEWRQPDDAN